MVARRGEAYLKPTQMESLGARPYMGTKKIGLTKMILE